jgi:DNA-binding PadR family transcriptional regulator
MLADGLVAESGEEDRRRYYRLTTLGRQAAKAEAERLAMLVREAKARKLLKLKTT